MVVFLSLFSCLLCPFCLFVLSVLSFLSLLCVTVRRKPKYCTDIMVVTQYHIGYWEVTYRESGVYRHLITRSEAEVIKWHKYRGGAEVFMGGKPPFEVCNLITPRRLCDLWEQKHKEKLWMIHCPTQHFPYRIRKVDYFYEEASIIWWYSVEPRNFDTDK